MGHIALYRAWRPQLFKDIVGQQYITQTLQNSLREQRISHAYLFSGLHGTGKTSVAKILAKAVNCKQGFGEEPCNVCETCQRITTGAVMDVMEIDAASHRGVEEIRELREKVKYAPVEARYKVYIIDEVHMLTTEAFNALLKTLEEPPANVMFILATTEQHRLPATIISRCQRFEFRRIPLAEQVERLGQICKAEHIQAEQESLVYIAKLSDGGMRDAISLLDQVSSFTEGIITYEQVLDITGEVSEQWFAEFIKAIQVGDMHTVLSGVETLMQAGKSVKRCIDSLLSFFRDLLVIKTISVEDLRTERLIRIESFRELADGYSQSRLFHMIDLLNHYQTEMKFAAQPQILFEIALLQLATQESASDCSAAGEIVKKKTIVAADHEYKVTVQHLQQQVALLTNKVEQLLKSSVKDEILTIQSPSPSTKSNRESSLKPLPQVEHYFAQQNNSECIHIRSDWEKVLQLVKQVGVTIHAWLINGEPVSCLEDRILLAFKNSVHKQTIEKTKNKQIIEQILAKQFGKSYQVDTVMAKDWEASIIQWESKKEQEFQVHSINNESDSKQKQWVDEAIQLFGEDLVVIKD